MLLLSQSTIINLKNSSFEGVPQHSHTPKDWYGCGFPGETPPDTHPDATFQVSLPAYDGNTYLGLVVRDNNTWESVSQKLGTPLLPNQCYELSFFAARSEIYRSLSSTTGEEVDYNTPAILRIWGGNEYCDQAVFLAQTELITETDWQEITVSLRPTGKNKCTYIIIEAYYSDDNSFAYNGNVLLDNIQPIVLCNNGAKQ